MDELRLWKIKESQLEDLQKQEVKRWYDKIITLGEKNRLKILTFRVRWAVAFKESQFVGCQKMPKRWVILI